MLLATAAARKVMAEREAEAEAAEENGEPAPRLEPEAREKAASKLEPDVLGIPRAWILAAQGRWKVPSQELHASVAGVSLTHDGSAIVVRRCRRWVDEPRVVLQGLRPIKELVGAF